MLREYLLGTTVLGGGGCIWVVEAQLVPQRCAARRLAHAAAATCTAGSTTLWALATRRAHL